MTAYEFIEKCVIGKYRVVDKVKEMNEEPAAVTDILSFDEPIPETLRDYELAYILPCIERTPNGQYDAVTRIICKGVNA